MLEPGVTGGGGVGVGSGFSAWPLAPNAAASQRSRGTGMFPLSKTQAKALGKVM